MAFSGWPDDAVEFFVGLQADNSKTYWTAHRSVYESAVLAPMTQLLDELAAEFGAGRISRPYRDVRFSADKSPYKTAIYATLERGGYVRFSPDGLTAGQGYYMMAPDQLDRYRRAVADDTTGPELVDLIERAGSKKIVTTGADALKSAPRGYPRDHPRVQLLRYKGLIAWRDFPVGAWLGTAAAKKRVLEVLREAAPIRQWLDDRVGPSTAPAPARR